MSWALLPRAAAFKPARGTVGLSAPEGVACSYFRQRSGRT